MAHLTGEQKLENMLITKFYLVMPVFQALLDILILGIEFLGHTTLPS